MRKKPVQQRSQQMVETLIDAAARTVAERGLANTTTNHIAARAGVSVGSLYQYFATKEALIDALSDRMRKELTLALDAQFRALLDADLRSLTRAALNAVFDYFEMHKGLYLELARHWHDERTLRTVEALESYITEAFRLYLLRHHAQYRFENLPAALFIVFNSTVFTGMRYMSQPQSHLKREDVIEGLVEMVAGYLVRTGGTEAVADQRRSRGRRARGSS
jgi:AcrR family transcriptional regulator